MKLLVACYREITDQEKASISQACGLLSIPGVVDVIPEYKVVPGLEYPTTRITAYGKNIHPRILLNATGSKADWVHVIYTDKDWERLGIDRTFRGEALWSGKQILTYGAFNPDPKVKHQATRHLPAPFNTMSELTIGLIHEVTHGKAVSKGYDKENTDTHYYMYGYKSLPTYAQESKQKRWTRESDMLGFWRKLHELDGIKEINGIKMMAWLNPKSITHIIIHHTAVQTKGNQKKSIETRHNKLYGTYIFNKYGRRTSLLGSSIGYNLFLDVLTPLEQQRVLGEETTANIGQNGTTRDNVGLSIVIAGNMLNNIDLSDNQDTELSKWIPILIKTFPNAKFYRHGDLEYNDTKCSGLLTTEFIQSYTQSYTQNRKNTIVKLLWQVYYALQSARKGL